MPGDAVLFRLRLGAALEARLCAVTTRASPGIGLEVARWLAVRKITVTGGDT